MITTVDYYYVLYDFFFLIKKIFQSLPHSFHSVPLSIVKSSVDRNVSRTTAQVITRNDMEANTMSLSEGCSGFTFVRHCPHKACFFSRSRSDSRSFFSSASTGCLALPPLWWDQRPSPSSSSSCCTKLSSLLKSALFPLLLLKRQGRATVWKAGFVLAPETFLYDPNISVRMIG